MATPRDYTPEDAAADSYTKDLEDMLGRFIGMIKHDKGNNECRIGFGFTAQWLAPHCPICEAQVLLERTG